MNIDTLKSPPGGDLVSRRDLLSLAAVTGAGLGVAPLAAQVLPPGIKLPPLPPIWDQVPIVPLWPRTLPSGGYQPRPVPADLPRLFTRNVSRPELRVFVPPNGVQSNGRAVLAMPGGAYTWVSILNEGIDVASRMTPLGYTVFVLVYRLPDEGWTNRADVPLQDAQRAMRVIRESAPRYRVDPTQIYAVGFSAGGHLAASLATGFADQLHEPRDRTDSLDARPRAVGMIYPVISLDEGVGHAESTVRLVGTPPDAATILRRSPARHVTAQTPPGFLFHAIDDGAVPVENSLIMLKAMRDAQRPVEAHLIERGGHGFGAGQSGKATGRWPDLFLNWIDTHAGGSDR